jgi:hypothetical protein
LINLFGGLKVSLFSLIIICFLLKISILSKILVKTQFVKICNLFINDQSGMLCFTDEFGNLAFFDINDGNEIFKYIEVIIN